MKELKKVPDLSIIFDMGVVALRFLMPVYAIIIVYQCFAAMRRRRRPETPLISLLNPATGEMLPVLFWENSIGRSKSSDVTVDTRRFQEIIAYSFAVKTVGM